VRGSVAALTTRAPSCCVLLARAVRATCVDGLKNSDEDGVDCGGAGCPWPCGQHSPSFHHYCNGLTPTLTIVQTTDGYIFGGVHVAGRSIPPRWGSNRFRLAPRTCAPVPSGRPCRWADKIKKNARLKDAAALLPDL
jgi:hypothetical protein